MKKIINFFWFIIFLSFSTYAIPNLRLLSVPIPFGLLLLLVPFLIIRYRSSKKLLYFNFFLVTYILLSLFINLLTNSDTDYTVRQFLYPITTLIIANLLDLEFLPSCLIGLYISSFCILIYGIYGFITWNVGDPIQHSFGYFGITYLESTRNGDLVYLIPGLILSFIFIIKEENIFFKIFNSTMFFLFLIAVIANQSRGGFIVILFSVIYLFLNKKKYLNNLSIIFKILVTFFFIFCIFLFFTYFDENSLQIILERFKTIFFINGDTVVTYNSNSERIEILFFALKTFISNIFGIGISGLNLKTNGNLFHAENAYISILVYYGFLGLSFFSAFLYHLRKNLTYYNRNSFYKLALFLIFYFLTIYSLFNLMIDMLPFWLLLGLTSIGYNFPIKNEN